MQSCDRLQLSKRLCRSALFTLALYAPLNLRAPSGGAPIGDLRRIERLVVSASQDASPKAPFRSAVVMALQAKDSGAIARPNGPHASRHDATASSGQPMSVGRDPSAACGPDADDEAGDAGVAPCWEQRRYCRIFWRKSAME